MIIVFEDLPTSIVDLMVQFELLLIH